MDFHDVELEEDRGKRRTLSIAEMTRRLLPRFRPHRRALALGLALLLLGGLAELAGPLVLRGLLRHAIDGGARGGILVYVSIYAAVFALASFTNYQQVVVLARMGLQMVTRLKEDLFAHLCRMDMGFFDTHAPGTLLARVESDCQRLVQLFSEVALALLRSALLLGGILAVLLWQNWLFTLTALAVLLPMIVALPFTLAYIRRQHGRVRALYARISTFLGEYLKAVGLIQVYNHQKGARARLATLNREKLVLESRLAVVEYGIFGLFLAFEILSLMALFYVGSREWRGQRLDVPTLVLFIDYIRRLFQPILQFSEQLAFIQRAFASADRVLTLLERRPPMPLSARPRPTVPRDWQRVAFEGVDFQYGGPTSRPALQEVSFELLRGQRLALVGLSGGGKTTITKLLLRFYEPTRGRITIDGRDIREYDLVAWRRLLGLVLQDIHLFPGSVGDNLRVMDDAIGPERLRAALATVTADEVIARLKGGLDGQLADDGHNLSMGERQLLSFARALVREPDILVLDEATASVDPATERRIEASLERLLSGRTALIVAHRLSTVMRADRILVVQQGRLVQQGDHATLEAGPGIYRDLFRLQFAAGSLN